MNINTAVSNGKYEDYKIVYMPAYNIVTDAETEKIKEYVKNGGTLVLTFRSGTRDEYNRVRPMALPGVFKEIAGIEAVEFDAPRKPVKIYGEVSGSAEIWCDIIKPDTAKTICTYGSEYYKGESAVTVNEYGKGRVYYVGCDLDNDAMKELVRIIAKSANVETVDTPNGVEVVKRDDCTIILNHNENEVDTKIKGVSLFDGLEFNGVLDGYGVQFLEGSI